MPITRKQFELEIDSETEEWMKKIDAFLTERYDQAFTPQELYGMFSGGKLQLLPYEDEETGFYTEEEKDFFAALEKLVELGAAEMRTIRDQDYYSYGSNPYNLSF